eukprot:1158651-Pelagomonas_calceolata.AAC.2
MPANAHDAADSHHAACADALRPANAQVPMLGYKCKYTCSDAAAQIPVQCTCSDADAFCSQNML